MRFITGPSKIIHQLPWVSLGGVQGCFSFLQTTVLYLCWSISHTIHSKFKKQHYHRTFQASFQNKLENAVQRKQYEELPGVLQRFDQEMAAQSQQYTKELQ